MTKRWLALAALALAAAMGTLSASAASATDPVTLDAGFVTDQADVLSADEEATVEARLQELTDNSTADLFVVLVDDFTNPSDNVEWADTVAEANNLGTDQYLLAIAVDGRNYYISAPADGPLSFGQLDDIEEKMVPLAADGDWVGAITLAADEIQGDGGAGAIRTVLIVVAIIAVGLLLWLIIALVRRSRRNAEVRRRGAMPEKPDPADPFSTLTDQQVETQAGLALVQADDAITSSKEELGFAVAQFGEGATEEFTRVVEAAKAKIAEAFDLQQKLDDEIEDTIHDRRAWHIRIIQIAAEIDDVLDDNTEAFDALRKLEQNAPQELERVRGERAALDPVLAAAAPALATLSATYAPDALGTIADNPAQAQERAALADRSIAAATQAIAAGRSGEAAFAIRTAEQSVAQAAQLAQAVTTLGSELAGIETQAQALVTELQGDLAAAQQLPDADGTIAAAASATARQLQLAQADLAGTPRNPQRVRGPHGCEHPDRRRHRPRPRGRRALASCAADARADPRPGQLRDPRGPRVHRDPPRHGRVHRSHPARECRGEPRPGREPARHRSGGRTVRGEPRPGPCRAGDVGRAVRRAVLPSEQRRRRVGRPLRRLGFVVGRLGNRRRHPRRHHRRLARRRWRRVVAAERQQRLALVRGRRTPQLRLRRRRFPRRRRPQRSIRR
ncbi:TPM domain-containing protein [Microbacterium sp. Se63.02b]|uniref:TPM domain-containing protein n=1 Tax=Microbacterium sp. Se63.02b TaxID=2709304 RepID=UPI001604E5F7|nr:TPM domain-containing protein [Microbacterium sp. Se63.02b]QNA92339.1 hypothetical protein G4G29_08040 [Microbacterium sp. Se63.02b]